MLVNRFDTFVGRSLRLYGEHGHHEINLLMKFVGPGDVMVDVGANIGTFAVPFARAVGETGLVHAFEPQRLVFQMLCANVAINNLINVVTHPSALGAEAGSIHVPPLPYGEELSIGQNNFASLSLGGDVGELVPIVTIDSLPLTACKLLKIDVEGMEHQVLLGARRTILSFRPIMYVENDRPANSEALIALLRSYGYRLYVHNQPLYNPDNFFGNAENVFDDWYAQNLLCIPDESSDEVNDPNLPLLS